MFLMLQRLCDYVCDLLLEESNVQPVTTPVTVCGDIHGQVRSRSNWLRYFTCLPLSYTFLEDLVLPPPNKFIVSFRILVF